MELSQQKSKPFSPYEQLLAVLPPHSCQALPPKLQALMTDPNSPLKQFYPNRFEVDVSGKQQVYQGIVLLPFIDEQLLRTEFDKIFN